MWINADPLLIPAQKHQPFWVCVYMFPMVPLGSNSEVSLNHLSNGDAVRKTAMSVCLSVPILDCELIGGMDHIQNSPPHLLSITIHTQPGAKQPSSDLLNGRLNLVWISGFLL